MDLEQLVEALKQGDRRALSRAITLTESELASDRELARDLRARLAVPLGATLRLGITGPPGVGKSTLIDALGELILAEAEHLAVLAFDPSSRTGGSILADKTRMARLVRDDRAFVRPSPTRAGAGGIGAQALSTIRLCEEAGFAPVIVETVGVGQAEVAVADLVDVLVVVLVPHLGDELQGLKRGLLEYADVVVVNKADGELSESAEQAREVCEQALGLFGWGATDGAPRVLTASAREGHGIDVLWAEVSRRFQRWSGDGSLVSRRAKQRGTLFLQAVARALSGQVLSSERARQVHQQVARGELEVEDGVAQLLADWRA